MKFVGVHALAHRGVIAGSLWFADGRADVCPRQRQRQRTARANVRDISLSISIYVTYGEGDVGEGQLLALVSGGSCNIIGQFMRWGGGA